MAEREPRQGGLGDAGRARARRNLGRNTIGGQRVTEFEKIMFGSDRADPGPDVTPWEFPESSRVKAYQYDFYTGTLRVRFHKYDTPWVYEEVPLAIFQAFDAAPSKGMYINSTLNHMIHRRATAVEEAAHYNDV